MALTRRQFILAAAAIGCPAAWAAPGTRASRQRWQERRDLYPQGVASGDPQADSVILWTRHVAAEAAPTTLTVEVALDPEFGKVVATATTPLDGAADGTCRVLVGNLRPATEYWYRFTDADGNGSRIGRTLTAPGHRDARPVKFAFVSCQAVNEGAQNAYRRMLYEDRRAPAGERLGFVLHLGDFIYEVVQYPDEVKTRYDRTIYDIGKLPDSRKVGNFHVPTTLAGYRAVYQAYLQDPDIQDARAYLPFVAIWDNHEFSWQGWQSFVKFGGTAEPRQTWKVAAMQAWFEYQPARIAKSGGPSLERFEAPQVVDAPITKFDDAGLGDEPNNLAAINSLIGYRALRYGRNVELIVTDNRSFAMEEQTGRPEVEPLVPQEFNGMFPEEATEIIDAGRAYGGGKPPDRIRVGDAEIANFARDRAPYTILGEKQRRWFIERLKQSQATWKVWGCSMGALDFRIDLQNLPDGLVGRKWPGGFAGQGGGDFGAAYAERGEIYDALAREGINGFITVSGDRHSFWAGYAAKALPPKKFEPVGLSFVTGSISAPGLVEAYEHRFPKDSALRPLYLADGAVAGARPEPTVNMTLRHGVRASLEYARSRDVARARALSNPDHAPHLKFVDMGGHGYSTVRASARDVVTEFVCIPRPIRRSETEDGGPLLYRVTHRAALWRAKERPVLEQQVLEGDPKLSI